MKKFSNVHAMTFINLIASVIFSSSVFGASNYWEETNAGYTIYSSGGFATTSFNDLSTPRNVTSVTKVYWDWNNIPNGNTSEVVELCYWQPNTTTDTLCLDISSSQNDSTDHFDGVDARGTFRLRFTIFGGTYPAWSSSRVEDTIRVDYDY
jgi:hypothetical protein